MNGSSLETWREEYMRLMDTEYGNYGFADDPVVLEELALEEEKARSDEWKARNKSLVDLYEDDEESSVPTRLPRLREIEIPAGVKATKHDLRREMLRRIEQGARTVTDFRNLGKLYDYLEDLEAQRVGDHEILRNGDDFPLEYGENEDGRIFPGYLSNVIERQMRKGDFLDAIYCKPDTVDELVTTDYIIHFMRALEDYEKQLFYYEVLEGLSSAEIAKITGKTDRAIRKKWKELEFHLKQRTMGVLIFRSDKDFSFTGDEQRFLDTYREEYEFRIEPEVDS